MIRGPGLGYEVCDCACFRRALPAYWPTFEDPESKCYIVSPGSQSLHELKATPNLKLNTLDLKP